MAKLTTLATKNVPLLYQVQCRHTPQPRAKNPATLYNNPSFPYNLHNPYTLIMNGRNLDLSPEKALHDRRQPVAGMEQAFEDMS